MEAQKKMNNLNSNKILQHKSKIYNIECEQYVLGALINNNENFSRLLDLNADVFYEPLHQRLFSKMLEFYIDGKLFDPVLLKKYFENDDAMIEAGGANYLLRLASLAGGIVNVKDYANELTKLLRQRKFEMVISRFSGIDEHGDYKSYVDANTPIDEVLTELEDLLFQASKRVKIRTEQQVAYDIAKELEVELPCYSTGLPLIDKLLGGGIYQSNAYSLIARRKTGKTATLGTFSHNLSKQGVKHMYIALEMGSNSIHRRIMGHIIGYNPIHFMDKTKRNQPDFQKKVCKLALDTAGNTIYADAPAITFDELRRLILSSVRRHKLAGVIVDHIHIIGGQKHGESEAKFYGRVAQWLADVAKQEKIFTFTACQANDDGSVKWSKDILGSMDMNFYLYRPDDQESTDRWAEVKDVRDTIAAKAGSAQKPAFEIGGTGVFLKQKDDLADYAAQESFLDSGIEFGSAAREKEVKRKF